MRRSKIFFLLALLVAFCQSVFAQKDTAARRNNRYLQGIVYSAITDVALTPYTVVPNYILAYNPYGNYSNGYVQSGNNGLRLMELNIMSIGYKGWLNIAEFTDNTALSLGFEPIAGFGYAFNIGPQKAPAGAFSFELPVFAELHFGMGATYNATKSVGFSIGGGIEAVKAPLFSFPTTVAEEYYNQYGAQVSPDLTTFWIEPCLITGITFWTASNYALEIQFKAGFEAGTPFTSTTGETLSGGGRSFSLSVLFYLGY